STARSFTGTTETIVVLLPLTQAGTRRGRWQGPGTCVTGRRSPDRRFILFEETNAWMMDGSPMRDHRGTWRLSVTHSQSMSADAEHEQHPQSGTGPSLAARATDVEPRGGERRFAFTVEQALWAVLVLAAILTRFWDLGYRVLHHDESLHAYYSW